MAEERIDKLRSHVQLSKEIASQTQNPQKEHLDEVKKFLEEHDTIFNDSSAQLSMQEMLLDLKVIDNTNVFIGHCIKNLQANSSTFNSKEYADNLIESISEHGQICWDKLTQQALPIINRCPGVSVLLGTFKTSAEPLVMPERTRKNAGPRTKDKIVEKQTAEEVTDITPNNDTVDVKVTHVLNTLKKLYEKNRRNAIEFYRFVLHPTSFTISVENIFYLSFIIRDGLAALDVIDGEFMIWPVEKKQGNREEHTEKNQMVFSITMAQYQEMVTRYQILQPAIKWNSVE